LAFQHFNLHSPRTPNRCSSNRTFQELNPASPTISPHKPTTTADINRYLPLQLIYLDLHPMGNNLPNSLRQTCRSLPK